MKRSVSALSWLALSLLAAEASAGWHAKQTHRMDGQPQTQVSDLYYEGHKLRIDTPEQSMILDLATGAMTIIDPKKKAYAEVSLDRLVGMRDDALQEMRSSLSKLPPQLRGQVESQLEAMERASKEDLKLTRSGKKETINGFGCELFTWSGPDGTGEACIAAKLPVDTSAFQKDVEVLRGRLSDKGMGTGAASLALLQLAREGFPVRTRQTMSLGPSQLASIAELTSIERASVPADKLKPPAGFTKKDFKELAGTMGPAPGPGPKRTAPQGPKRPAQ